MNEKKKILFIMPNIGCGGVETTLFSLWDTMDREKYDITLLLIEKKGAFLDRVPKDIKIKTITLPEKVWGVFYGKRNELKRIIYSGKLWKLPDYFRCVSKWAINENRTSNAEFFDYICDSIEPLEGFYDLAIDYFGYATFTTFYLAEKVNAKVKVSWLHSVFSRFHPEVFAKWYAKMDVIYAVSKTVKEDFQELFPNIETIEYFYNIKDPQMIRVAAEENGGFSDEYMGTRILTVGRVCHEKGMDMAAEVFSRLNHEGYKIRWYIVGNDDTPEKDDVVKHLKSDKDKDNFCFLGVHMNPFPYMEQCDIYVQPSRFEGYCTTTNEARILCKPIVMTDVSGAREQIENGLNGLIVESSVEGIYQGVKKLLDEPVLCQQFSERLKTLDCDTRGEVKKLEALLQ